MRSKAQAGGEYCNATCETGSDIAPQALFPSFLDIFWEPVYDWEDELWGELHQGKQGATRTNLKLRCRLGSEDQ